MKKTVLLSAIVLMAISTHVNGQAWNMTGTTANTYTNDNVGIGSLALPTDANLHIRNHWGDNSGCMGYLPEAYMTIPAIKIDDKRLGAPMMSWGAIVDHNIFEIWHHDYMCSWAATPTSRMSFFVNDGLNGALVGINKATAATTLDVGGGANIDKNLAVQGGMIDMYHPADNLREIIANSDKSSLNLLSGHNGGDGAWITMAALNNPTHPGYMGLHTSGPGSFDFWNYQPGGPNWLAKIDNGGSFTLKKNAHIQGGLVNLSTGSGSQGNIIAGAVNEWLGICAGNGGGSGADGAYLQMFGNYGVGSGSMYIVASGPASSGTTFFYQPHGGTSTSSMTVRNDGKVLIGTGVSTPGNYRLYVQDGILTERLRVANHTDGANWADFVFDKDYDLLPLEKVEAYVKRNKHLPEIPSAAEVGKNGIDVAEMDAKLLQKIEELTLYVIQQQKEIDALKSRLKK